jgi:hypothetical protein
MFREALDDVQAEIDRMFAAPDGKQGSNPNLPAGDTSEHDWGHGNEAVKRPNRTSVRSSVPLQPSGGCRCPPVPEQRSLVPRDRSRSAGSAAGVSPTPALRLDAVASRRCSRHAAALPIHLDRGTRRVRHSADRSHCLGTTSGRMGIRLLGERRRGHVVDCRRNRAGNNQSPVQRTSEPPSAGGVRPLTS